MHKPLRVVAGVSAALIWSVASAQEIVQLGAGSYYASAPEGFDLPEDGDGNPVLPRLGSEWSGPVPTNEWWSSLVWARGGQTHGLSMYPGPLSVRGVPGGLARPGLVDRRRGGIRGNDRSGKPVRLRDRGDGAG